MSSKAKNKHLPVPAAPPRKKLPRVLMGVADGPVGSHPKWGLSLLDLDHAGSWSWGVDEVTLRTIVAFLCSMERLTWTEIRAQTAGSKSGSHRKHHTIATERLCAEALQRLRELSLDDQDELFRFRHGNFPRLWGIVEDSSGTFYPLWWDPDHKVYPLDPD